MYENGAAASGSAGGGLAELESVADAVLAGLEPGSLLGSDARRCLAHAVRVRNKVAAIESLLARRVAETPIWQEGGAKSAAAFVAKVRGTSVSDAAATLDAVAKLDSLPLAEQAWRAGELSPVQLAPVVQVASERPGTERRLVDAARTETVTGLRKRCVEALNAGTDAEARHRRVH